MKTSTSLGMPDSLRYPCYVCLIIESGKILVFYMCVQSTYTREIEVFTMFTVNFRFVIIFENKIDFTVKDILVKHFFKKRNKLQKVIQYVEEDIQNYSPTVMFRGTPCIF